MALLALKQWSCGSFSTVQAMITLSAETLSSRFSKIAPTSAFRFLRKRGAIATVPTWSSQPCVCLFSSSSHSQQAIVPVSRNQWESVKNRSLAATTRRLQFSSSSSYPFNPRNRNQNPDKRPSRARQGKQRFVPRKAAVEITDRARILFQGLLKDPPRPEIIGIALNYEQSKTGEPRMVFSFSFVTPQELGPDDEPVSLEVVELETHSEDWSTTKKTVVPKPPRESWNDGLPKLFVRANAFMKVLGATVDVDAEDFTPVLYDKDGNRMDPNA